MRVVIVGGGKVGSRLSKMLLAEKHDIVLIEKDPALAESLSRELDTLIIPGDGTSRRTLTYAGIEGADFFTATTGDDKTNLLSCEIAKRYNVKRMVSRVVDPENYELFQDLDIVPINEVISTVSAIHNVILQQTKLNILATLAQERVHVVRVVVGSKSKLIGKKVKDTGFEKNLFLIERGQQTIYPERDALLLESDTLYAAVDIEDSPRLAEATRGEGR